MKSLLHNRAEGKLDHWWPADDTTEWTWDLLARWRVNKLNVSQYLSKVDLLSREHLLSGLLHALRLGLWTHTHTHTHRWWGSVVSCYHIPTDVKCWTIAALSRVIVSQIWVFSFKIKCWNLPASLSLSIRTRFISNRSGTVWLWGQKLCWSEFLKK